MLRALYTAASGMSAQETNLDNVANSSTAGFRKRRIQFEDLLYQNVIMPGTAATQQTTVAAGLQVGLAMQTLASKLAEGGGIGLGRLLTSALQKRSGAAQEQEKT